MRTKTRWRLFLLVTLCVSLWVGDASAQSGLSQSEQNLVGEWLAHPIDAVLKRIEGLSNDWTPKFLTIAMELALALIGIETAYRLIMTAVRSEDPMRGAVAVLVKQIFRGGFAVALIQYG